MRTSPVDKQPVPDHDHDIYVIEKGAHASIEALFQECAQLQEPTHSPTVDEVEVLSNKTQELEEELSREIEGKGKPILRIFSRLRMFSAHYKISRLKSQITNLRELAEKAKEQSIIERIIWHITRKGFITTLEEKEIQTTFDALNPCLQGLGCSKAFAFKVLLPREDGALDFFLLEGTSCQKRRISLKTDPGKITVLEQNGTTIASQHESVDSLIANYAKEALCLNQLQDVAAWLEKHGAQYGMPCDLQSVEMKLAKLMNSCPHGAYIMYPISDQARSGAIGLSRLLYHGDVHHFTIDLKKQPGTYTFDLKGGGFHSASRREFMSKLAHMGAPVKIK